MNDIKQQLVALDANLLQDFVIKLYQKSPELKEQIDTLLLYDDPAALSKLILKRIQSVSRGRKFIDWRLSHEFSLKLIAILTDIEAGLVKQSPKHAFALLDKFIATGDKVFERLDDSSGEVSEVYRDAILLWLKAANAWKDSTTAGAKINWLERVYDLSNSNDYGLYDLLLSNSAILLSHDQLLQLAWRYEAELKQAIRKKGDGFNEEFVSVSKLASLQSVAEALKDPKLYERASLITSPELNDMQKRGVIEMYLQFNQTDDALRWLNTSWQRHFEIDRLNLLVKAYEQKDDKKALKQTLLEIFQGNQNYHSYKRYQATLSDDEIQSARIQAIKLAQQADNLLVNVDFLLHLDEAELAQKLLLEHPNDVKNGFYDNLLGLAKQFEKHDCLLAQVVCYRSLLLDILESGRTKAYGHGVKYFNKLSQLAESIDNYSPIQHHLLFIQQLDEKHGKKYSFWDRVL